MATIDYQSTDLGRLAPDEVLIWSGDEPRARGGGYSLAKVLSVVGSLVVVVTTIVWLILPRSQAVIGVVWIIAIGMGLTFLGIRDSAGGSSRRRSIRFTDRRLIVLQPKKPPVQLALSQLKYFRFNAKRRSATFSVEQVLDQRLPISAGDVGATQHLLAEIAGAGAAARETARRWRRAWRPAKIESLPTAAEHLLLGDDMPELLAGESVLWSGRPTLKWRADFVNRLVILAKASPWSAVAIAIIVAAYYKVGDLQGALIGLSMAAGLLLFGQFATQIWNPIFHRRALRQSSYVLTTHRLIAMHVGWREKHIGSVFFDDEAQVGLELLSDGRGTIRFGQQLALERIEQATTVHTLVLRAVAGFRQQEPIEVRQPPNDRSS